MTDAELRNLTADLLEFPSVTGAEAEAQAWLRDYLADAGFEVYTWEGDAELLSTHPSFPNDPTEIETSDRPSVAGVAECGDPDAGSTLVLNGHIDVVPVEEEAWTSDPFTATWLDGDQRLRARGAADMKASLAACIWAVKDVMNGAKGLDGRLVVESVIGEEAGGIGAAQAAMRSPYPFERDAAVVAEPTELSPVLAVEGCLMKQLRVTGRSAHAATRWRGESVLPHFIHLYEGLSALEAERAEEVTHPLFEGFENPWPVNVGTVEAGSWASSVPAALTAGIRIGVAPGESVAEVERVFEDRLAEWVADDDWLSQHPPEFERFSVQFEPAEVDASERIVRTLEAAIEDAPRGTAEDRGATYGADSRHYLAAGIPTVVFGPGTIEQAHFPDETIAWEEVRAARDILADTAERFLRSV